ncbi:hypothetical protein LguiB_026550 [Lonicera macranthoides]
MTRNRSYNNVPQPHAVEYYSQRTTHGGLVISESAAACDISLGCPNMPGIWRKEQVEAWKPIVNAVHEKGGIFFCQIWHPGYVIDYSQEKYTTEDREPRDWNSLFCIYKRAPVPQLTIDEINSIINDFKVATRNAIEADLIADMVRVAHYVDCAFNFNNKIEAFIFTADQCLRINYAPGTTDDYIIKGPMSIGDYFPSLKNTIFATGIDAAFTSSVENEAYIFKGDRYILLNFVSGNIIGGPKKITDGFYSLKDTIFEDGIDAAFASSRHNEAYIFRGDQYALINFAPGTTDDYLVHNPKKIIEGFPSLKGTVFQDGLDAAFSAKATNEAYIFKGDTYARINYAPGTTNDYIINIETPISDGFHSLKGIIPSYT